MRILFIGFGDLAYRCAKILDEYTLFGVARSPKPTPPGVTLVRGDVSDPQTLTWVGQNDWDVVVITLTPSGRGELAYRQAYVESCEHLAKLWSGAAARKPGHVIYVSSSGVYAQDDGSWIDEQSPALPSSDSGKCLREAETIIENMKLAYSIVRFSGIYGPGRDFIVRQVLAGKAGNPLMSNRIHQDDCAGFLAHLVHRIARDQVLESLYLASDNEPCTGEELRCWMADYLGITLSKQAGAVRAGNKRCNNSKMLASGYKLSYPSYKNGYMPMLKALQESKGL